MGKYEEFYYENDKNYPVSKYWDLYDMYYYVDIKSDSVDTARSYFSERL